MSFSLTLSLFLLVYTMANYYVDLRLFQTARGLLSSYPVVYWGVVVLLALAPFAARLSRAYSPGWLNDWLSIIGNYWLAALYYLFLGWALVDLLRLAARLLLPALEFSDRFTVGIGAGVLIAVGLLLVYGAWNAHNPRVRHYDVTINKRVAGLHSLRAVMVSDIHLGPNVDSKRLEGLVGRINRLKPDIIFLAGDTIDEDVNRFAEQKMPELLAKLETRYGVYAVLGNHEYLGDDWQLAVTYLQQAGVQVLRDQYILVNNQFYIVGRDDRSALRMTGYDRMPLAEVMQGVDRALPVILLDHQPYNLEQGQQCGADLQLSGHTHHGQFFPNNLLTERIYETDWGYLDKDGYQIIVSCGYGTWGPPIRIGNYPEIVEIAITFADN